MGDLLCLALFALFVGLGLRCRRASDPPGRRQAVNAMLAYTLAVSAAVAVTQWDAWPFTTYTLAAFRQRVERPICLHEFWAADAAGREWPIDPYSWSPVFVSTLQTWFDFHFDSLPPDRRQRALRFLLERAEAGRQRLAAGRPIGYDRRLGQTLSAPYWWLAPRPAAVAPDPYLTLRVYRVCRVPSRQRVDPRSPTRVLRAEYPA